MLQALTCMQIPALIKLFLYPKIIEAWSFQKCRSVRCDVANGRQELYVPFHKWMPNDPWRISSGDFPHHVADRCKPNRHPSMPIMPKEKKKLLTSSITHSTIHQLILCTQQQHEPYSQVCGSNTARLTALDRWLSLQKQHHLITSKYGFLIEIHLFSSLTH